MKHRKPGDAVIIDAPENARLHLTGAVVRSVEDWGAHLSAPAAATGRFRAIWDEMADVPVPSERAAVPTGEVCICGGLLVRTGTCLTCQVCGASSGGCS